MKDRRVNVPKEFNRLLHEVDTSKSVSEVFNDFLTLSIYSIAQPFYRSQIIEETLRLRLRRQGHKLHFSSAVPFVKYLNTAKNIQENSLITLLQ